MSVDENGTSRKTNTDKQLNTVQKIFASSFCKQQHVGFAAQVLPTVNNRFSEIHENGSLCLCICGRGRRNETAENIANTSKNWYYKIHQDTSKYYKRLQIRRHKLSFSWINWRHVYMQCKTKERYYTPPPYPHPPPTQQVVGTCWPKCCCAAHEDCKHLCKTGKSGQLWAVKRCLSHPFTHIGMILMFSQMTRWCNRWINTLDALQRLLRI